MTTVLKLGGSVITEKGTPETVDEAALADAAAAVGTAEGDLVLVHGGGSFGHHHADRRGVTADRGTDDAGDIAAIHDAMGRLNARVIEALHEREVPALPVRPLSTAHRDAEGELTVQTGSVERMLGEGFVPVAHGDVVAHARSGATVASGDSLVAALAGTGTLGVDRVGLCSTVPGVLDERGEVIPTIDRFADVADAVGASDATDVTGGMAGKVRTLLDLPTPAHVFGPDDLSAFLAGESPGTRVGHE